MIKNYTPVALIVAILGVVLVIISKYATIDSNQITGICFGVGIALALLGFGHLAGKYVVRALMTAKIQEDSLREEHDERNIRVREKAGWNASRITIYILLFLTVTSAFMNLEFNVTILFILLILIESSLVTGSLIYYEKRM